MTLATELPADAVVIGKVEIVRYLSDEHEAYALCSADATGEDLGLLDTLGLLTIGKDIALREYSADCTCESEDADDE